MAELTVAMERPERRDRRRAAVEFHKRLAIPATTSFLFSSPSPGAAPPSAARLRGPVFLPSLFIILAIIFPHLGRETGD